MGLNSTEPPAQHPPQPQPLFHLVLTGQARTAYLDLLLVGQHGVEMPVASEFCAAHTDTTGTDRLGAIADAATPLD